MGLTLEHVSYDYAVGRQSSVRALEDVSLEVGRGELVLVVGATGSGKTTLMKLAAGLLEPTAGTVVVDGTAPVAGGATNGVGLIFQDAESQLFADTLLDDVAFGPLNQKLSAEEARDLAARALDDVGLDATDFGERSPFSLSGGESRRAAIAGVLAMNPAYLLADEPTAGLDARGRLIVRDLLLEQRRRGGVVVVTHVAEEFLEHADRLVVLDRGSTTWAGAAADAIARPSDLADRGVALPDVLEALLLARSRGLAVDEFTLDPARAARVLATARRAR